MPNALNETSAPAPLPYGLIARLVNCVGVNLVEAHIRPVPAKVVLEKGQCDSHKIEIKISARVSFPVNEARRGCDVPVMGGDRACRRSYTYQPAFLYRRRKKR
jgi:hypothetical protein